MRYIITIFLAILFFSCDNELDLIAEKKEVPVVYGIIDQTDTAQYIRVERIFVDEEIKPELISQNPDSLYYEDIVVKLVRTLNGTEYELERVDGNLEGYVRDEGIFANTPNYLYKIRTEDIPMNEDEEIELRIEGIFEDRAVTSTANILEPPFLVSPQSGGFLAIEPNKRLNIGWTPKGEGVLYTVLFHINITETLSAQEPVDKRLTWIVTSGTEKRNIDELGQNFFSFLVGALEKNPSITRRLNSIEFELITGNESIADYIRVGRANLGITSSGEIPVFSNIEEGLGIFGATHTHLRTGLQLTQPSLDTLRNGPITAELNVQ